MSSPRSETRRRILESTWRLLEESGGMGVSMSAIARAAGVSRQAVYLHFPSRTDLLVATVRHVDRARDLDARLEDWRAAERGLEMLDAFVVFWGSWVPEIYPLGRALLAASETDEAASEAWKDRMGAVRRACEQMVDALDAEGRLDPAWTPAEASDLLWTMLSMRVWEQLTVECGWSRDDYVANLQSLLRRALVRSPTSAVRTRPDGR